MFSLYKSIVSMLYKLYCYIEEKGIWKMAFPLYEYDVNKMLDDAKEVFKEKP